MLSFRKIIVFFILCPVLFCLNPSRIELYIRGIAEDDYRSFQRCSKNEDWIAEDGCMESFKKSIFSKINYYRFSSDLRVLGEITRMLSRYYSPKSALEYSAVLAQYSNDSGILLNHLYYCEIMANACAIEAEQELLRTCPDCFETVVDWRIVGIYYNMSSYQKVAFFKKKELDFYERVLHEGHSLEADQIQDLKKRIHFLSGVVAYLSDPQVQWLLFLRDEMNDTVRPDYLSAEEPSELPFRDELMELTVKAIAGNSRNVNQTAAKFSGFSKHNCFSSNEMKNYLFTDGIYYQNTCINLSAMQD